MDTRSGLPSEQETAVKHLLRQALKRHRPSRAYSVIVRHGTETDANREFASDREGDAVPWFLGALPIFVIIHVICVKIGAI
ncbi:hypothetical protein M2175_004276 [Bradyrhizobium elkanii]|uniref:hypothetical protein n=1 Tax=Bradyrhizobium elkanii TaxID=29448 RepID=UPI000576A969|nr:hypothetical protein [Bradyrhizobium elkanii]MCS3929245.1 hypothetical protein [Bradyrhizobium elkanii]MCS3969801.1 hypothetical protein [Bradyrhizobium japonicum]